jgi:hypothetical protein
MMMMTHSGPAGRGPKWVRATKGNTKVTIYNGTDCRLCEAGREGELLER